jgi:hypothetical protein
MPDIIALDAVADRSGIPRDRQPTVREFQARMAQLLEFEQRDADRCAEAPAGTEAIRQLSPAG